MNGDTLLAKLLVTALEQRDQLAARVAELEKLVEQPAANGRRRKAPVA